ncbi:MAG: NmrA family NAD(P)-binding protein [Steroidobacteraceae bacterium]
MILITGATGRTGHQAALDLAAKGCAVRALVRNADKAAVLKEAGVDLLFGDAADATAVDRAMKGINRLIIILPNGEQQLANEKNLVDRALANGIRHILKVSSIEANAGAINPIHHMHFESEQHIRRTGIPWTFVRPSFYMQNFLASAATVRAESKLRFPFAERGAAVLTDADDVGHFIAEVISAGDHGNQSYDITSGDKLRFSEVAEVFGDVLGRRIEYVAEDPVAYRARLGRFLTNQWHLDAVCDLFAEIADGYVGETSDDFRRIMGREPTSLREFVARHRQAFAA